MKKHTDYFMQRASYFTLILAFIIIIFVSAMLFYPYKVVDINGPVKVLTRQVRQGEQLLYQMDYCSYRSEKMTLNKKFVDGIIYNLPSTESISRKGCRTDIVFNTYIPDNLPPGNYVLWVSSTHKVNPLREITVSWETEPFIVVSND